MLSREEAYSLVTTWTENKNLVKHMLCVEAAMIGLAKYFKEDENLWRIVGLLHDADYDKYPNEHPLLIIKELEEKKEPQEIIDAIKSHAWGYRENLPEPKNNLEWSLYCCDELTGLIVAVTLIRPEKKLSVVTVDNVLSKWAKKDFAKGVERGNIEKCEEKLGIKLPDFVQIVLSSMQRIASELGL